MKRATFFLLFMANLPVWLTAQQPRNIIFILSDDHRYDAMGFMNRIAGLNTPGLDLMAAEGGLHIPLKRQAGGRFDNLYNGTY